MEKENRVKDLKRKDKKRESKTDYIIEKKKIDDKSSDAIIPGDEFIFDYVKSIMNSVDARYGTLVLLNEQSNDLQLDKQEINKILDSEKFEKADAEAIVKLDEVEKILNEKIVKFGGYKKVPVSEQLMFNLEVVSKLNRRLKNIQKLREERRAEKNQNDSTQNDISIFEDLKTIKQKAEINSIKEATKPNPSKYIVVYGKRDKNSAFTFDTYDVEKKQYKYIQTEERVEQLKAVFEEKKSRIDKTKQKINDVINADLSTSFGTERNIFGETEIKDGEYGKTIPFCTPEAIAEASISLISHVEFLTSNIENYKDKVKWADSVLRHAKKTKPADFQIKEIYQKLLEQSEKQLAEVMNYGKLLDKKLAEVKKYRAENKSPIKNGKPEYLIDKFVSVYHSLIQLGGHYQTSVSKQIAKESIDAICSDLKKAFKAEQGDKNKENSSSNFEIADMLNGDVLIKKEEITTEFKSKFSIANKEKIAKIASDPNSILKIIDTLQTGTYFDGQKSVKISNDEILDLIKILSEVKIYIHENSLAKKQTSNKNASENKEDSKLETSEMGAE